MDTPGLLRQLTDGTSGEQLVRVADDVMSFGELLGAATVAAQRLGGKRRVCVRAVPRLSTVVAVVGGLLAGVSVIPVPSDAGPTEVAHIERDSQAQAWAGEVPAGGELPGIPIELRPRSEAGMTPEPPAEAEALVLYTSGTTGLPKGVPHTRAALAAGLDGLAAVWAWTKDDVLVHGLPLYHVHGLVLGVLGALRVGSALVHTERPTPAAYAAVEGSLLFGVPTVWHRLARDPDAARRLAGARLLVSGSAALPAPVFDRIRDLTGHEIVERYGMTETLITVSARWDRPRRAGWVGWPIEGISTRLRGDDGGAVAHDGESVGELLVRGPVVFDGYLGQPEATAASFTEDGWFVTGDVATIAPDGCHRIVGRTSVDLIKTGGFRVGAGEIEAELLAHPGVVEAAVVGVPDDDLGQRITAFVVPAEAVTQDELISWVAQRLSVHKRPREVHFVDAFPRNAMGKVVKSKLVAAG